MTKINPQKCLDFFQLWLVDTTLFLDFCVPEVQLCWIRTREEWRNHVRTDPGWWKINHTSSFYWRLLDLLVVGYTAFRFANDKRIPILPGFMGTNLWWFVGLTKDSVANSGRVKGVVLLLYGNLTAARWFRKHFSKGKGCDFKDMYFFQRELVSHLVGKN